MDLASRLANLDVPPKPKSKPASKPRGFQPVTVVKEPVTVTRRLVLVMAGVSAGVSLVINTLSLILF